MATRKPVIQRKHMVHAKLNVPELTKAGSSLELDIYASGEKLGELTLGRGAVYWRGGRKWQSKRKRYSWTQFAEIMNERAYG